MDKITFNYENRVLDVDVIYKKRKNISIKIIPKDKIQIIAPNKVSREVLENTIDKNSKWIVSKLNKFKHMEDCFLKRDYVDGEVYYYKGRPYNLKIIKDKNTHNEKKYNYISIKDENIEIRTNNWKKEYLKESLKKWYNIYYVKDFQGGRTMSKKHEAGKIFVKVMAALLAALMVLAVSATLIFYIINK